MTESTQHSETSEQIEQQPAAAEKSPREKLAEFLKGESQEGKADESPEKTEPKGEPKGKPKALKDLAETLKLSDADLYAIEVPMADGKSLSIGKMKDAAAAQDALSVRELAFEERVSKREAEWTRQQQEFDQLLSLVDPKAIKPEMREHVRRKVESDLKRERELTLQHIPEWQNETVRNAELAGMVEYLRDYGIHESFLVTGASHKLFRLVRDSMLRKQRIDKALAAVEPVRKPSTTGKSAAGNGAARKPQAAMNTRPKTARDRLNAALTQ